MSRRTGSSAGGALDHIQLFGLMLTKGARRSEQILNYTSVRYRSLAIPRIIAWSCVCIRCRLSRVHAIQAEYKR